jgi:phosphoglycolate phosphatase
LKKATIIFDFDGTLYDSYEGIMLAFNQSSIQLFNIENYLNKNDIGPKLKDLYARAFDNLYFESYSKFEDLFRKNYDQEFYKRGKLYECVEELLAFFDEQGYDMYIVSNKPQKILNITVEELKITKYFKLIVGSNSSSNNDGNKIEKLNRIIEFYDINKDICFVLGDTVEDLNMAKSNNCIFIHANYGYGQINESCISIDSIQDLKEIIIKN